MRLTKEIKRNIVDLIIKEKTKKSIFVLDKKIQDIAQEEADMMFGKDFKDWASKAKTGWLPIVNLITLYIVEENRRFQLPRTYRLLSSCHRHGEITLRKGTKVPAAQKYGVEIVVSKGNAIKLKEILKEIEKVESRVKEISTVVTQALASVNTSKQLGDNYPDLVKYLPTHDVTGKMLTVTNEDIKNVLA